MEMTGGCLCGAVRYTVDAEPAFVGKCYCSHCHKESGTGHITVAGMPEEKVKVTGEVRQFHWPDNGGGHVIRHFCPQCGSTLFSKGAIPGLLNIRIGSLDDSSKLKATIAIFGASASPWDEPPGDMQVFPQMPTG